MAHPYIDSLLALQAAEDRGALAALRQGAGKAPGEAPALFPYVVPYLPARAGRTMERAYYLVGSLFGLHPGGSGARLTLAAALAKVRVSRDSGSIEQRFVALLQAHPDDLGEHLRHAVTLARAEELALDWEQLLNDLGRWDWEDRRVQRAWARQFWGRPAAAESTEFTADAPVTK